VKLVFSPSLRYFPCVSRNETMNRKRASAMKHLCIFLLFPLLLSGCSSSKPKSQFKNGSWNEFQHAEKFTFGQMARPKPKENQKER